MDKIEVVWTDGSSLIPTSLEIGDNYSKREVESLSPVVRRNVGYLVKEDEKSITIAFGIYEWATPRFDKTISILRKSIIEYIRDGVEYFE